MKHTGPRQVLFRELGRFLVIELCLLGLLTLPGRALAAHGRPAHSSAIIVLGGYDIPRVSKAVELYQGGMAQNLILTGGNPGQGTLTEAETMYRYALMHGVPKKSMYVDNRSKTTYQNAVNSLRIMRREGWTSAIVVTSNFHVFRARSVFSVVYYGTHIRLSYSSVPTRGFHPGYWWTSVNLLSPETRLDRLPAR